MKKAARIDRAAFEAFSPVIHCRSLSPNSQKSCVPVVRKAVSPWYEAVRTTDDVNTLCELVVSELLATLDAGKSLVHPRSD